VEVEGSGDADDTNVGTETDIEAGLERDGHVTYVMLGRLGSVLVVCIETISSLGEIEVDIYGPGLSTWTALGYVEATSRTSTPSTTMVLVQSKTVSRVRDKVPEAADVGILSTLWRRPM
jgi:hypothetical protein